MDSSTSYRSFRGLSTCCTVGLSTGSSRDLHVLQPASLLPCDLHHGLQGNVCSDTWSTSSHSFSDLHVCRTVSHIFLLIFCHSCFAAFFFYSFLNMLSQGHCHCFWWVQLWPEVGPSWSWLCPTWEQTLLTEVTSCRSLTTKTLSSKPGTKALNYFRSKPCFVFMELIWELVCVCMCVCVFGGEQYLFCVLGLGFFVCLVLVCCSFFLERCSCLVSEGNWSN